MAVLFLAAVAQAQGLTVRAVPSSQSVRAGDKTLVALEMAPPKGFWVDGPVPGGQIVPPRPLTVSVGPSRLQVGKALFPPTVPHTLDLGGGRSDTYNVYERTFAVFLPVAVPPDAPAGACDVPVKIQAQVCDPNTCLLPTIDTSFRINVGTKTVPSPAWTEGLSQAAAQAKTTEQWRETLSNRPAAAQAATPGSRLSVGVALGLALLAGVVLNVMPCVLPVIPLKVLSIVQQARQSRRRFFALGMSFVGGILLFFAALATLNAVLRAGFQYTFQWGDHFRQPAFIYGMALLLVTVAMNLFGVLTVLVPGRMSGAEPGEGVAGAVGMGVLTGVLSTPCSFGILTAAVAWAQGQPLWLGTAAILLIGVGMAVPYAVLTAFPRLLARVPRAGRWSELLKQGMGFVMLLVVVWLIGTQMEQRRPVWVLAYAVVLAACLWAWSGWVRYDAPARRKWAVRAVAALLAVAAGWWMLSPHKPLAVKFEPFDQARIDQARAQGRIVLIDFTADWCWTCKAVEWRVYNDPAVAKALRERNVLVVRGDTTTADLPADRMLTELGEPGVPVTVIFPPGDRPGIRLHGVFGPDDLLKALDKISGRRVER